ncbi:MAG TPA: hypothetical protein VH417_18420 [Vicinamibacterales bacterium]|jgi:hypothetical protein
MSRTTTAWLAAICAALFVTATHAAATQAVKSTAKPAATTSAKTAAPGSSLTGCLENDGDHFKLTNLPEGQAPKARTWKTAYVTKSTKDVEVTGAASLKLKDHIGHKVTITGTRDGDTHVKATSVKMVAKSCS